MAISFGQVLGLFGAGTLAAAGLFVWFAGSLARRHDETADGLSGCLLAAIVLVFMAGSLFLICRALLF